MPTKKSKEVKQKLTKVSPSSKVRTRSDVYNAIAGHTGLARKQVVSVFDGLGAVLAADLGKKGPGIVQVPGLMKVTVKRLPATKAREGINPFTKEPMTIKAKPARKVVKAYPLKSLKEMVK